MLKKTLIFYDFFFIFHFMHARTKTHSLNPSELILLNE